MAIEIKRYLIVKHFYKGTYQTDEITRADLASVKNGECEEIIDTKNCTYFDHEKNSWEEIPEK